MDKKHVERITDGLQTQRNRFDSYPIAIRNPSDMLPAQGRAVMPPDPATTTSSRDTVELLHEQLNDALQTLVTSEDWQRALTVAARFHTYSFANTQLIWSQSMARGVTPTRVAGYQAWRKLNRQVRRGERGLAILAPLTRKVDTDEGEDERRLFGFKAVHVFDVSQTDGEPLPEILPTVVEGDLPTEWGVVTSLITDAGFSLEVTESDRLGEANGITDYEKRQVVVRASLPGAQRFKTAVHELAHVRLHEPTSQGRPNCRGVVEVEAESVSFMVCASVGMDSAGYSLPYVAGWSGGDLDKVASTADRVIRCAHSIIDELETSRELEERSPPVQVKSAQQRRAEHDRHGGRTDGAEQALRLATSYYEAQLQSDAGSRALDYLHHRGINIDAIRLWQLGYAPAGWDHLVEALHSEGISDDVLVGAGVAGRSRTGKLYDRMRGRVVFPVFDVSGSPRGFAGRLLTGEGPKYLNTPETEHYSKRTLLYGFHLAKPAMAESRAAVVVEGYTDVIVAAEGGIGNVVATGGTALTVEHLAALRQVASTVTLAFDGDEAGLLAAQRVAELPRRAIGGINLRIAELPAGEDPASLVSSGHVARLNEVLDRAVPLVDYLIDELVSRYNLDEPEAAVRAMRGAGALISQLAGSEDKSRAVSYLARRVGRSQRIIEQAIATSPTDALARGRKSDAERSLS